MRGIALDNGLDYWELGVIVFVMTAYIGWKVLESFKLQTAGMTDLVCCAPIKFDWRIFACIWFIAGLIVLVRVLMTTIPD